MTRMRKISSLLAATALLGTSLAVPRSADRIRGERSKISAELWEKLGEAGRSETDLPVIVRVKREFFEHNRNSLPARSAIPLMSAFRTKLTPDQIHELSRWDITADITFDSVIHLSGKKDNSPPSGNRSDYLAAIGADQAQERGYTGKGVTVAVFDSGIGKRPDIDERIAAKVDFTTGEAKVLVSEREARKSPLWKDEYGHGTHVAGIVASSGYHSNGVYKGVAPEAEVLDLRVVGPDGTGRLSDLLLAIDWLVANKETYKVGVANLSLGRPAQDC